MIADRCRQPVGGSFLDRIAQALAGVSPGPILDGLAGAAPGLRLPMLVTLVEQLAAAQRHASVTPATPRSSWQADPTCPRCQGTGWEDVPPRGARPCECRRLVSDTPTCETVAVEGAR